MIGHLKSLLFLSCFGVFSQTLNIQIENIKDAKAPIKMAIFKKGSNFPKSGAATYYKEFFPNQKDKFNCVVSDIPMGEYAIAVFQDINLNNKMDTNLVGYPAEPFGFTKNFKPRFSAPRFSDCAIEYSQKSFSFNIKLL